MVGEVRLKAILRILSPCRPGEGRVHLEDVVVNEMLGVCHEEDTEYSSELFTGTLPGGLSFLGTASPHRLPIPILTSVNTSCSHSALSAMTKPGALPPSLPPSPQEDRSESFSLPHTPSSFLSRPSGLH